MIRNPMRPSKPSTSVTHDTCDTCFHKNPRAQAGKQHLKNIN